MKYAFVALALAVAALGTVEASAADRRVRINNYTDVDILRFYASNKGTTSWEEDILGRDVLPARSSLIINIDDGSGYCKFDFLAVFADGDELVKYDNDVCSLTDFNYY